MWKFSCEIAHYGKSLISIFQFFLVSIDEIFILGIRLDTIDYNFMKFWDFPDIFSFAKILDFKFFCNSYIPCLLLVTTFVSLVVKNGFCKNQKVSKYYDPNGLQNFVLLFLVFIKSCNCQRLYSGWNLLFLSKKRFWLNLKLCQYQT